MKEDLLKHLLESVLGPSKSSRGARGEQSAVFTCPSCNHRKKKLTVNLVTQQFQCWVCNFKGHRAFKLLKEAKANPKAYDTLKSIDLEYKFKKSKQPKYSLLSHIKGCVKIFKFDMNFTKKQWDDEMRFA